MKVCYNLLMTKRNKKTLALILISALVLALIIIFVAIPLCKKTQAPTKEASSLATQNAEEYYKEGLQSISEKNYKNAITSMSKAIELDPFNSEYYNKKAEAEVQSGLKEEAVETIKTGLANIPGDILLKNKLDVLQNIVK